MENNYGAMTFGEANKLNDADFAEYVIAQRVRWRDRMIAEGMVYFPEIDRWYPAGTEIKGVKMGEYIP